MKQKILSLLCALSLTLPAIAAPKVVSSIYPLQQIANAITGEKTDLVVDSYLSPHDYAVTPANVEAIRDADVVLWIGAAMMPQMDRYVDIRLDSKRPTITASQLPNIHLIKGEHHHHHHGEDHHHGEGHGHDEKHHDEDKHHHDAHAKHDEHEKGDHHHGHKDEHHDEHKHEHHDKAHHDEHNHDDLAYDPHLWLSTKNANVIAKALAETLSQIDPANQARYHANLQKFTDEIAATKAQISASLNGEKLPPFFVFHDAYQYFEEEFGVKHTDTIRVHSAQAPRTKHLVNLQKKLAKTPHACLFREPQFESPLVDKLVETTDVTIATLDPVGYRTEKDDGEPGYPAILTSIARQLQQCGKH